MDIGKKLKRCFRAFLLFYKDCLNIENYSKVINMSILNSSHKLKNFQRYTLDRIFKRQRALRLVQSRTSIFNSNFPIVCVFVVFQLSYFPSMSKTSGWKFHSATTKCNCFENQWQVSKTNMEINLHAVIQFTNI